MCSQDKSGSHFLTQFDFDKLFYYKYKVDIMY